MNRRCTVALCVAAACASAKDPAPAPYIYPFGPFTAEAHANALSLCPGPHELAPMPSSADQHRAPVEFVRDRCEGPMPQRVSIQTEWDRGTDRIFWMHLSMNISDADFDQGLDAVVAKAFDPWIKNASHDQIIEAIKTDTLIGSSAWHLSGHVSRAGGRPGWASVIVDVDDTSVDKEKAAREALKDYQRSIGRDAR